MPRRTLILSLAVCLLPACATLRTYPGPGRPDAEVARLAPAASLSAKVYIVEVDGRRLGPLQDRVELAPGTHRVRASVLMRVASREVEATRELKLEARAGARYALHAAWGHYGVALFILDQSGARVGQAAARPPGLPQVGGKLPQVGGKLPQVGGKLPQVGAQSPKP